MNIQEMREQGYTWEQIAAALDAELQIAKTREAEEEEAKYEAEKKAQKEANIAEARKNLCDAMILYCEALEITEASELRDEMETALKEYEPIFLTAIEGIRSGKSTATTAATSFMNPNTIRKLLFY